MTNPYAIVICASVKSNDSRLQRICGLVKDCGFDVVTVAYTDGVWGNAAGRPQDDLCPAPSATFLTRVSELVLLGIAGLSPAIVRNWLMRRRPVCRSLDMRAHALMRTARPPSLVVAKHWTAIPTALSLARASNAALWLDVNEVFAAEHETSVLWRAFWLRAILRTEREGAARADILTCTSAEQIRSQPLPKAIYTPNTRAPLERRPAPRPGQPLMLLYHGLILQNRAIGVLLEALALCRREDLNLIIRAYGKPKLMQRCKILAAKLRLERRVTFTPPVAQRELLDTTSLADVGVFLVGNAGMQLACSEPNKIYEYMAAGLAVVATATPSTTQLFAGSESALLTGAAPQSVVTLANVFASLKRSDVDAMRLSAWEMAAAKHAESGEWRVLANRLKSLAETAGVPRQGDVPHVM